jgi:uncharacterized repeat protein (TIGR01451 family)
MKRRWLYWLILTLALLVLSHVPALLEAGKEGADRVLPKIEPSLLKEAMQARDGEITFLVYLQEEAPLTAAQVERDKLARRQTVVSTLQETAAKTQRGIKAYLEQQKATGKVKDYTPYWIFNGLAVTADRETLLEVAGRPEVKIVCANHKHQIQASNVKRQTSNFQSPISNLQPPEWNISRIRADLVWNALGINGTGVVVASMDSGVDWQHPALMTQYRGYNPKGLPDHVGNWYCATDEGYLYPGDGHGHGTHTMGTILGDEGIGVAPGSQWIAVKAFDNLGVSYDSWIHAGFQWLLAPAGDPALAPDVVNCSWGDAAGADETFRPDVQALRAAGVFPVFAAGNSGPAGGTIYSPASFPEAFAVGATDQEDEIVYLSGRGPSPWGETKPDVSAPGANIRSSTPGGGYELWTGTSMAAPHATGLAALLLQAKPNLTITEMEQVITSTALNPSATLRAGLGNPIPNNDYGWGRIDAYQAVVSVANAGLLTGRVTRAVDGAPLVYSIVEASERDSGDGVRMAGDAEGYYSIFLAPATYDVTATAFAYEPVTRYGVTIVAGTTEVEDFSLTASPVGVLFGRVTEAGTNAPLQATIAVLDTPATVTTDPATGLYSIALPAGTYQLKVSSPGHRIRRASDVSIEVDQGTVQNFTLPTAPTILLVDSGAWYYESQIGYFQQALDGLDYLYDTWTIKDVREDVPQVADLLPYDIVVWSCPKDSPAYVGAWDAIGGYLEEGGRLLITGQDIGYWDGGGSLLHYSPYYTKYLQAIYVRDDAGSRQLTGLSDDILAGIALTLNGGDSADNQLYPDEITPVGSEHASSIIQYQGDGSGGVKVGLCLPYRLVYLSFGLEGISDVDHRQQVMERAIDWLVAPPPAVGVEVAPVFQTKVSTAGSVVTHTLRIRNTGQITDTYHLSLLGNAWPTALWDGDFTTPLTEAVRIASCYSMTVGISVEIPSDTDWDTCDAVTLTTRSASDAAFFQEASFTSKTSAPILLVDDDRWYNMEDRYQAALASNGYPYDYWSVGWNEGLGAGSPHLATLQMFPMIVWFTGYDWYNTLTPAEEEVLATYLEGGGRLFFSAQDYLYTSGLTDFGLNYLGVLTYTESMTITTVNGVAGNPVGDGLGPYHLAYPFDNWSDTLIPTESASSAFVGDKGQPCALTHYDQARGFETVFFAFPFETLKATDAQVVMGKIVSWLSWLGASTVTVDKGMAAEGDILTYTIVLKNTGTTNAANATLSNTIPTYTIYVPHSLSGGASYDLATNRVHWQGTVVAGTSLTFTYQAAVVSPLPDGTAIVNTAQIGDGTHIFLDKTATTVVDVPDLSPSTKQVDKGLAGNGDPLTYTITLRNVGTLDARIATLWDAAPRHTTYIAGSASASSGTITDTGGQIQWAGQVSVGSPVTITYGVMVSVPREGFVIANHALINDGFGNVFTRTATTLVPARVYLPLIQSGDGSAARR